MSKGIDYGMGMTNIDRETGIRFGVIPMNDLFNCGECMESDYGPATCGHCGNEAVEYDDEKHGEYPEIRGCSDYACEQCERVISSEDAFPDEPAGYVLQDGEYTATSSDGIDAFVTKSPYFTRAGFCSPCAPGACYLTDSDDDGERAYCFGHDWFDGGKAPYRVFRVDTGEEVLPG